MQDAFRLEMALPLQPACLALSPLPCPDSGLPGKAAQRWQDLASLSPLSTRKTGSSCIGTAELCRVF